MIKNSGVVYTYTPSSHDQNAKTQHNTIRGEFKPGIKNKGPVVPPVIPSNIPTQPEQPVQPVQPVPGPIKQPPIVPQKPTSRLPIPPLPPIKPRLGGAQNQIGQPPRFRPPTPRFPAQGSKPVPWNDPFAFEPPRHMPSKYAQAKNLSDFMSPYPVAEPQKEFHHGLPIEETPEIPLQVEDLSHDLDTTYVDRLFGTSEPAKVHVQVEEIAPVQPEEKKTVELEHIPAHEEPVVPAVKAPEPDQSHEPVQPFIPQGLHEVTPPSEPKNKKNLFSFQSLFSRKKQDSHQAPESIPEKHTDSLSTVKDVPAPDQDQHGEKQPSVSSKLNILRPNISFKKGIGIVILIAAAYGLLTPIIPRVALEATYAQIRKGEEQKQAYDEAKPLPAAIPLSVNPMVAPDGKVIEPVNTEFSLVIPSVGINAAVIPGVNPLDRKSYEPALKKGVAQAKTSYLPTQNGTMYLFSHSTNYEWFVSDLNAIFYNVKNLKENDYIVVFYQGKRYVYQYKSRQVVSPKETSSLIPETGAKRLILQTCWPPGSVAQRLLIYADLVEES